MHQIDSCACCRKDLSQRPAHLSAAAHCFFSGRYFCSCSARNCAFSSAFAARSCSLTAITHLVDSQGSVVVGLAQVLYSL